MKFHVLQAASTAHPRSDSFTSLLNYNCSRSTQILLEQWRDVQVNDLVTALQLIRDASVAAQYKSSPFIP